MRLWKVPVRWSKKGSGAPKKLQEALRTAQNQLGTRDQVHRMAQRLEPQIGKLNSSIAPGSAFLGKQTSVISNIQTLLSIFAIAISATVVLWHLPSGNSVKTSSSDISTSVTRSSSSSSDTSKPGIRSSSRRMMSNRTVESVEPLSDTVVPEREPQPIEADRTSPKTLQPLPPRHRHKRVRIVKTRLDPEDELKILRRAQDNLVDRPLRSLEETEQHRREYPSGVFAQEREMIAIEALFQLSRANQGLNRAKRFLERYGDSTHAPRVRSLLEKNSKIDQAFE